MRIRLLGACLCCALLTGAAAATSASAVPGFLHSGGPLTVTVFTGKATGPVVLDDPTLKIEIRCSKGELEGLIEPGSTTHVEEVIFKLKGCVGFVPLGGKINKCAVRSAGAASGTIRTKRLDGDLFAVPVAEAADERGLDLKPEIGSTLAVIVFATTCGQPNRPLEGSVIGEPQPKGPPEGLEKKLVYGVSPGPAQMIQLLPSGAKDTLSMAASETALAASFTLKFGEVMEVA
jgi:hypothetical protein